VFDLSDKAIEVFRGENLSLISLSLQLSNPNSVLPTIKGSGKKMSAAFHAAM